VNKCMEPAGMEVDTPTAVLARLSPAEASHSVIGPFSSLSAPELDTMGITSMDQPTTRVDQVARCSKRWSDRATGLRMGRIRLRVMLLHPTIL